MGGNRAVVLFTLTPACQAGGCLLGLWMEAGARAQAELLEAGDLDLAQRAALHLLRD